jgi:KaiC/GvpD/RAD55 family RecA-like ATPase
MIWDTIPPSTMKRSDGIVGDKRVKTYIEGLDEKMEGGVPVGNVVLLAGESGTMKSTVAYHMAFENARKNGLKALYLTMEQSRGSLLRNMEGLGMHLEDVGDKLAIVDVSLLRKTLNQDLQPSSWMEVVKMYSQNLMESSGYDLLILDSLPVLETLSDFKNPRNDLFQFYQWLRDLEVTTILVTEVKAGEVGYGDSGEDYMADGIVHLMMAKINEETVQRRIRIVKMRATNHSTNLFSLLVEKDNLRVARAISA